MLDPRPNVLRRNGLVTKNLYRQIVSQAVRKIQLQLGLTDEELADRIGASDGTIANARNQHNSLSGELLANLLDVDELALEGLLHHFNRRSVPIESKCDTDELVSTTGAVHKLALAKAESSHGGAKITDHECLELEPELDAALESLAALKNRCHAIHAKRNADAA